MKKGIPQSLDTDGKQLETTPNTTVGTNCSQASAPAYLQRSRPKQVVQLFTPIDAPVKDEYTDALIHLFAKDYDSETIKGVPDREDLPLFIVCPVVTRYTVDIDEALEGFEWSSKFVVLVLHPKNECDLPRETTGQVLGAKDAYRNIEFIDIAFTREEKLYKCKMNKDAKRKIKSFLKKYKTKK